MRTAPRSRRRHHHPGEGRHHDPADRLERRGRPDDEGVRRACGRPPASPFRPTRHSIPFGALSLPKILGFKAVNGKLVETYDLTALKKAYGATFDGVQIQTASGKRAVTPQDVVTALGKALRGKTPAERVGVIATKVS